MGKGATAPSVPSRPEARGSRPTLLVAAMPAVVELGATAELRVVPMPHLASTIHGVAEDGCLPSCGQKWDPLEPLWRAIIRPPRDTYDEAALGPRHFACSLHGRVLGKYERLDLTVESRGLTLACSHWVPQQQQRPRARRSSSTPRGGCSSRGCSSSPSVWAPEVLVRCRPR